MAHIATDLAVTLPEDRPGMLSKAVTAVSVAASISKDMPKWRRRPRADDRRGTREMHSRRRDFASSKSSRWCWFPSRIVPGLRQASSGESPMHGSISGSATWRRVTGW